MHLKYGVEPDMAMFGKALGNGYAITAVIGRKNIMEAAQSTFISSTFWTERIGPSAALATLEVMKELNSWDAITEIGNKLLEGWQSIASENELEIICSGLPSLATFSFKSQYNLAYKTLVTQEMLKKGYLASNSIYACISHTEEIIDEYMHCLNRVFKLIKECEDGRNIETLLLGPICHAGFKRLN